MDPGLRFWVSCLPCVDDDRIEKALLWRNVLVAWNCWDFTLLCRLRKRRILSYSVNYNSSNPSCWNLAAVWLDFSGESGFPSLAVAHWAPSVLGPKSFSLHIKSLCCYQHTFTLVMVSHWFWVSCFLFCTSSTHLFLFCLLSICFFSSGICSVSLSSLPLLLPCWEKRKQWNFSLTGLRIHSCIIQSNIPLNAAVSGRGYWQ